MLLIHPPAQWWSAVWANLHAHWLVDDIPYAAVTDEDSEAMLGRVPLAPTLYTPYPSDSSYTVAWNPLKILENQTYRSPAVGLRPGVQLSADFNDTSGVLHSTGYDMAIVINAYLDVLWGQH